MSTCASVQELHIFVLSLSESWRSEDQKGEFRSPNWPEGGHSALESLNLQFWALIYARELVILVLSSLFRKSLMKLTGSGNPVGSAKRRVSPWIVRGSEEGIGQNGAEHIRSWCVESESHAALRSNVISARSSWELTAYFPLWRHLTSAIHKMALHRLIDMKRCKIVVILLLDFNKGVWTTFEERTDIACK